ncbi:MAG TPA: hypothetical protein DCL15_18125 [Chloroflexi bacterium]|nr:hypothetical protein [Chloroflexota bacterium]HHW87309.1 hypothetical protein [Chloroflexota bacterium]
MITDRLLLVTFVAAAALLLIAWMAARLQTGRRNQGLAQAFADSTRSRLVFVRPPAAGGFDARFEPAPEPFEHLSLVYRGGTTVDPIGLLLRALRGNDVLIVRGLLHTRPAAELIWARGRIPDRALARRARVSLWVQRRSDLIASEYAVRGADTTALEHVFVDLQARFGALLQRVSVIADREDVHVEIVLHGAGLRATEAAALIATVRAVGRAALPR